MLARASADVRVRPGDLIGSGTVGTGCLLEVKDTTLERWLQPGDTVTLAIDRLGELTHARRRAAGWLMARRSSPIVAPRLPAGLDTPALVIDLDVVERNARRLGGAWRPAGSRSGPHVKTHKSVALARMQLEPGLAGSPSASSARRRSSPRPASTTCSSPIRSGPSGRRPRGSARCTTAIGCLIVGIDSVAGAERLAAAVAGSPRRLAVLLEIDPGNGRTGAPPERAGEIAAAARDLGLEVGASSPTAATRTGPEAPCRPAPTRSRRSPGAAAALASEGIEPAVISAGSTPTQLAAAAAPVNEIRAGTYLIGDRQQWAIGAMPGDGVAIAVAATVVSERRPRPGGHRCRRQDADQGRAAYLRATASCPPTRTRSSSASPTTTASSGSRPARRAHQWARSSP